jgi:hypothetical protein
MSIKTVIWAVVGISITAFYYFINPVDNAFLPSCTFKKITGFYCPGCGGQRALHQLLHGHFNDAFHSNLLIYILIPIVWYKVSLHLNNFPSRDLLVLDKKGIWIFLSLLLSFTILRNIPYYPLNQLIPTK